MTRQHKYTIIFIGHEKKGTEEKGKWNRWENAFFSIPRGLKKRSVTKNEREKTNQQKAEMEIRVWVICDTNPPSCIDLTKRHGRFFETFVGEMLAMCDDGPALTTWPAEGIRSWVRVARPGDGRSCTRPSPWTGTTRWRSIWRSSGSQRAERRSKKWAKENWTCSSIQNQFNNRVGLKWNKMIP